jgi:hypothetical protein
VKDFTITSGILFGSHKLPLRGGEGKEAEIDSGYFGGYVKPANLKTHRVDRRFSEHQSHKRKAVIVIRERNGNTLPAVFKSEKRASISSAVASLRAPS